MLSKHRYYSPIILLLLCFLFCGKINAQHGEPSRHLTHFSFSILTGGIVIVQATLDDMKDSLNFVLDTGSGGISLDSITCLNYNIKTERSDKMVRGIAGVKQVKYAYDHTLNLPGLSVPHLNFHINDYDILSTSYGVKIDGIIGYSFFIKYIVSINYDEHYLDIYTQGNYKYPRGGYILKPLFTTLPIQGAAVEDNSEIKARFYMDSGAGLCMLLSENFSKDSTIFRKKRKMYKTLAEGLGGQTDMTLTILKNVKLGPYRFRNVPTYVFADSFNVTAYPTLGGLIGNDLLRRFNIVLNYSKREIHIKPNGHYLDSFDYSYTGLGVYLIDQKVTITNVIENSPAEKAGFQIGDVIVGVGNNFSNNIQTYKTILQNANTNIRVLVMRENSPYVIQIKVKSIL